MLFSNTFSNSFKNLALNLFKVLICFTIYFNSITLANAAGLNGWSLSNPVAKGASTLYQGAKNAIINGKNVAKTSTALITPAAADVAKVLRGGVAGYALSVAVEQLLGAVDWVLDPANNQIVYYQDPTEPPHLFLNPSTGDRTKPVSASVACTAFGDFQKQYSWKSYTFSITGDLSKGYKCNFKVTFDNDSKGINTYDLYPIVLNPELDREKKTLSLETVAQQVISNAESGDTNAQAATTAAAANIVSEAEKDAVKARPILHQLEANSKTATDETATGEAVPKDPTAPDSAKPTDISLEFPVFCGWAPTVCEAAQVVISFPLTLSDWWETSKSKADSWTAAISEAWASTKEYFKEDIKQEEKTEVQIEEVPKPVTGVTVFIGDNVCPTMPVSIRTPFRDQTLDISPTYLCQQASMIKTFFIAFGFWTAAMIVGRRN
ncbi:virulence factor TspB C-terminal domain-related protein [Acinetobacter sp.]|uniref:virulence factor TspB C-terminal domain-related protein n=1 Tax=Acinetobacter sp. TaxID=472 RepID=UPI002FC6E569